MVRGITRRSNRMNHVGTVGIIGLGYVGLPLAMEFCRAGVRVVGVDVDVRRVDLLASGVSPIEDVPSEEVQRNMASQLFQPTSDFAMLTEAESISICVPTPLGKSHEPDVSFVQAAVSSIRPHLQRGQVVILESTVYPGATEELVVPELEKSGLRAGTDFFVAFSPERIDPGNKTHPVSSIPKVVGGVTLRSTELAASVYRRVFKQVKEVGSAKEAEMTKLLENTFRAVNIGLVNELALVAHGMGINIWNVIEAAATKPFGFMPFQPGPGWGGHCIPVDPFYLTWRARIDGLEVGFIDHAGRINTRMPLHVADRVSDMLNDAGKAMQGSRILVLGTAYKKNVSDVRESPAIEVIRRLEGRGAIVEYHDPHVPEMRVHNGKLESQALTAELLALQDCVVILTDHSDVDYEFVAANATAVFDTRNVTAAIRERHPHVQVL